MTVSRIYRSRLWARVSRATLRVTCVALVATAIAPGVAAGAEGSQLTIERPSSGAAINSATPSFQGVTQDVVDELPDEDVFDPITLVISDAGGPQVQRIAATTQLYHGAWSAVAEPLADGAYTAQAIQTLQNSHAEVIVGESPRVAFTIDTAPPQIAIATPANASSSASAPPLLAGSAGTAVGDLPSITVRVFAGATIGSQPAFETLVVQASEGGWSAAPGGLAPGTYTAQAEQRDRAGNAGVSQPVTFVVVGAPVPPPPAASFSWFPASPRAGEPVSLVSSSTDAFSPITGFAWSLSSGAPFVAGKPVLATSFATPGNHVVRLQVTDAEGRSSVATETVPVSPLPLTLMQPFPIVRFAGSQTSYGARLKLLTVQAPIGASVKVKCVGRGCKTKSESRIVAASTKAKVVSGAVTLSFPRFERALRAGVTLQVRVTMSGQIGKFTSFTVRRRKLPVRKDQCVLTTSSKPFPCPRSPA
jgi:PKD repeat protein